MLNGSFTNKILVAATPVITTKTRMGTTTLNPNVAAAFKYFYQVFPSEVKIHPC